MKTASDPIHKPHDPLESHFYALDEGSPLFTQSFAGDARSVLYAPPDRDDLLLFEGKTRGSWGKGETEDERSARRDAQHAKTQETHQKVEDGLLALCDALAQGKSENFLMLLDTMSRFHRYSFSNTFLITFQRPDATFVAGFHTWKEMGRFVKSGEKGIAIFAPVPKRFRVEVPDESAHEGEETSKTTKTLSSGVWGFKVVYVFDVSQTEGKPLPEFETMTGDPAHYLTRLKEVVEAEGITIEYRDDLHGSTGRSRKGIIDLQVGLCAAEEFSTLVHEFAHELLHPKSETASIPKTVKETEAEAVAYVVSRAVGLEPGTSSSDYIQLYRGDTDTLAASLGRIQQTATQILSRLEDPGADRSEDDLIS